MHPMLKLLASNRAKGWFKVDAAQTANEATIYLYDMVVDSDLEAEWWGGVAPRAFIAELNAITAPTIHLRVNSPGGSVFAARAIEQALREHSSRIVAHVDGLAASAASFLIMAADEIVMSPGSFLMIHKAWTYAYGNADDFTKTSGLLEQIDGSLVKTYAKRSQQAADEIAAWMSAETWFESDRAVELGFADSVADASPQDRAAAPDSHRALAWDLSAFSNRPRTTPERPAASPAHAQSQPDRDALRRAALKALIPA